SQPTTAIPVEPPETTLPATAFAPPSTKRPEPDDASDAKSTPEPRPTSVRTAAARAPVFCRTTRLPVTAPASPDAKTPRPRAARTLFESIVRALVPDDVPTATTSVDRTSFP